MRPLWGFRVDPLSCGGKGRPGGGGGGWGERGGEGGRWGEMGGSSRVNSVGVRG